MVVVALLLLLIVPAYADDRSPPEVTLRIDGREQVGAPYVVGWQYPEPDGGYCAGFHGDGAFRPPGRDEPLAVPRGSHTARVRFHHPTEPEDVSISAYRTVDAGGSPRGRGKRLKFELKSKAIRQGAEIWVAEFRLGVAGDRYLDVHAKWPGPSPCGPGGYTWTSFHVAPSAGR